MGTERFVVVGLARARVGWFGEVSGWAQSGRLPIEFVKCVSAAELRARLGAVGAVSAVLLDAGLPGADRDLVHLGRRGGAAVLVVDDGRTGTEWLALGASAVLPAGFDADLLLDRLEATAAPIAERRPHLDPVAPSPRPEFTGSLVAVCGVPGAGTSTVSMAIAQGLAGRADGRGAVVLADLALGGDQGLYHAATDVVPGVQELIDAHRNGRLDRTAVRAMTFVVESRGYALLLGLRRRRDWTALPTQATDAALGSLRGAYRWVVADVTGELDGEHETGSIDVEERNHLARAAVRSARVVVVVGTPGVRGLRGLVRLLTDVAALGVGPDRIVAVLNGAPRSASSRHEAASALRELAAALAPAPPVLVAARRNLEAIHHAVDPLPRSLVGSVTSAVVAVAPTAVTRHDVVASPLPVLVRAVR